MFIYFSSAHGLVVHIKPTSSAASNTRHAPASSPHPSRTRSGTLSRKARSRPATPQPPAGSAANTRQPAAWAQGERLNDEQHDAHGFAHPSKKSGMVFGASLIGDIILLCNYSPPTEKFIINEIIFHITIVANKIFRLMDGEHNAHTKP